MILSRCYTAVILMNIIRIYIFTIRANTESGEQVTCAV